MSFDLTFFKSELDGLLHQLGASPLEERGQQVGAKPFQVRGLSIDIEYGNYSAFPYDAKRASMKYRLNVGWNKYKNPQLGAADQWPHPKLVEFMGNSAFDSLKNERGFSRVSGRGIGFLESDRSTFIRRVKEFLVWWDSTAPKSDGMIVSSVSASNSPNRIYVVAGERNVELAQATGKGLWVNVGQTTRQVADRLRDDDYKRKAAGGKWVILYDQVVGNLSDREIHPFLKSHPRVEHNKDSNNTEEFRFLDDPGDGSEAIKIVSQILSSRCAPLLKVENERLRQEITLLQEKLDIVDSVIGITGIDIENLTTVIRENEQLKTQLQTDAKRFQAWKADESRKNEERVASLEKRIQSDEQRFQVWKADESRKNEERVLSLEKEKKTAVIMWSAITGAILFPISWVLADNEYLEDLAKAQQARDIAYAALSTSDIQLKELQAKMELIQQEETKEEVDSFKTKSSKKRDTQILTTPAAKSVETASVPKPESAVVKMVIPAVPAPDPASLTPSVDRSAALATFGRCLHEGEKSNWVSLDKISKCNNGDDIEIKKCLLHALDWRIIDREVLIGDVVFCWKQTH